MLSLRMLRRHRWAAGCTREALVRSASDGGLHSSVSRPSIASTRARERAAAVVVSWRKSAACMPPAHSAYVTRVTRSYCAHLMNHGMWACKSQEGQIIQTPPFLAKQLVSKADRCSGCHKVFPVHIEWNLKEGDTQRTQSGCKDQSRSKTTSVVNQL